MTPAPREGAMCRSWPTYASNLRRRTATLSPEARLKLPLGRGRPPPCGGGNARGDDNGAQGAAPTRPRSVGSYPQRRSSFSTRGNAIDPGQSSRIQLRPCLIKRHIVVLRRALEGNPALSDLQRSRSSSFGTFCRERRRSAQRVLPSHAAVPLVVVDGTRGCLSGQRPNNSQ
jgi:hypothetical protein